MSRRILASRALRNSAPNSTSAADGATSFRIGDVEAVNSDPLRSGGPRFDIATDAATDYDEVE